MSAIGTDKVNKERINTMSRITVPLRDFLQCVVKVASEGGNQSTVAKELGITAAAVSLRLKSLRDKGVKVPELAGKRSANVVEDANDILAELGFDTTEG